MIPWYWYIATDSEIFLDLDSKHALRRAMNVLRRGLTSGRMDFSELWFYPTTTAEHYHLIVVLKEPAELVSRVAWSLWMGADQIRAAYVLERFKNGIQTPEFLCSRRTYGVRAPDDVCTCDERHKSKAVTDKCPAL